MKRFLALAAALALVCIPVTTQADTIMAVQLGCHQLASFSTSTSLTVDTGATFAAGSVEGNSVRYRDDGVAPTASVGIVLAAGANFYFSENLSNMQFIPTTGSATIDYCDYR